MSNEIKVPVAVENVEFADAALAGFQQRLREAKRDAEAFNAELARMTRLLHEIANADALVDERVCGENRSGKHNRNGGRR